MRGQGRKRLTPGRRGYIPAANHDWLLPIYDPVQRWLVGEDRLKRALLEQAAIRPGDRVLDLGCGTATLSLLIKRLHPASRVVGVDPDAPALERARTKVRGAGVSVQLDRGLAEALPYRDGAFQRVVSSFVLHHLDRERKLEAFRELRRVLSPGGSLHVLDFGRPRGVAAGALARLIHRGRGARDNVEGRIPRLLGEAGFAEARELDARPTLFGTVCYYRAVRPE